MTYYFSVTIACSLVGAIDFLHYIEYYSLLLISENVSTVAIIISAHI